MFWGRKVEMLWTWWCHGNPKDLVIGSSAPKSPIRILCYLSFTTSTVPIPLLFELPIWGFLYYVDILKLIVIQPRKRCLVASSTNNFTYRWTFVSKNNYVSYPALLFCLHFPCTTDTVWAIRKFHLKVTSLPRLLYPLFSVRPSVLLIPVLSRLLLLV